MDPITHALVGGAVAAFSGQNLSLSEPILWATVLGSMAPDADIIMQLKGDLVYLKHHRGFSHSLLGLALIAGGLALGLSLFFGGQAILTLWYWAFLGGVSHTLLDILNSYGAQVVSFYKKKLTLNLISLLDPVILLLASLTIVFPGKEDMIPVLVSFTLYLGVKAELRSRMQKRLLQEFGKSGYEVMKINVMPSLAGICRWDYVVQTDKLYLVGKSRLFPFRMRTLKELKRGRRDALYERALASKLGRMFRDFTPLFHMVRYLENGNWIIKLTDLRYMANNKFLHSATIKFDQNEQLVDAIFHPFSEHRNFPMR